MSEYISLSPVNWALYERLGKVAATSDDQDAIAQHLAAETYWSNAADHAFLAAIADDAAFSNSALPVLVSTRIDPAANAARAARYLLDEDSQSRGSCLAELARCDVDYPLLYDVNLLLACHSGAYAAFLFGDGDLVDGKVAYDGPDWLAQAVGGATDPQASRFALLAPAEVKQLAGRLKDYDASAVTAGLSPELRDFHHDNFGDDSELRVFLNEAAELLGIYYLDAADHGWGIRIRSA